MKQLKSGHLTETGSEEVTIASVKIQRRAVARESTCPIDGLLRLLMGPWTTYILWLLQSNGALRFGQLKKQMPGVSAKMLTERLRMLETARIIYREQEPTIPPKVTYGFTERGRELKKVLGSLDDLARKWADEI